MEQITIDVLIVGGGTAGVAAAVAAAEEGVTVALVEREAFLGGKATTAVVGTVCGLYYRSENLTSRYLTKGFAKTFGEKLAQESGTKSVFHKEGLHFLPYDPLAFKLTCDKLITEAGVDLYLHTVSHSVTIQNHRISAVEAFAWDRKILFKPKMLIDCSGEASICALAGEEMISTNEYQSSAQVFSMEGVEETNEQRLTLNLIRTIGKAVSLGQLSPTFDRLSIVPGSLNNGRVFLKLGIPISVTDESNKTTNLELFARQAVRQISDFLIDNILAFGSSHIGFIAQEAGIRTGKRPVGQYILTEEDVLRCAKFEDGIANGGWPIEDWRLDKKPIMKYFDPEDYYQVPARCLTSKDLKNLFFAGRNISASDEAIASARVIGTCLQTGYAAGKLAAFEVKDKDRNMAITSIKELL